MSPPRVDRTLQSAGEPAPGSTKGPRYRWRRLSAETRRILDTRGEAGRFEYKREANAVSPRVLVAAANAAALEGEQAVTILVGVDEETDPETGAVRGRVVGLERPVEIAKKLITSRASSTLPVPVHVTLYEENLETTTPILRVEVRPTRPPHYDGDGARVTRQAASHRPISDEELVSMYLHREAAAFAARFNSVAAQITGRVEAVLDDVSEVTSRMGGLEKDLGRLGELAETAAGNADETNAFVSGLDEAIGRIEERVEAITQSPESAEEAFWALRSIRERGALYFGLRRVASDQATEVLAEVLDSPPDAADYVHLMAELHAWRRLFAVPRDADEAQWLAAATEIKEAQGLDLSALAATDDLKAMLEFGAWKRELDEDMQAGKHPRMRQRRARS